MQKYYHPNRLANMIILSLIVILFKNLIEYFFLNDMALYETASVISIYFIASIFILLILFFCKLFNKLTPNYILISKKPFSGRQNISCYDYFYLIIILCLLFYLCYLGFIWQISVTGLIPIYNLPFKLNGLIYYLVKYVLPILIIIWYAKFGKNNILIELILFLFVFLTFSFTLSRFNVILILMPIIIYNIGKPILFFYFSLFIYLLISVTLARYEIYEISNFQGLDTLDLDLYLKLLFPLLVYPFDIFFHVLLEFFDRFDNLDSFYRAYNYDLGVVTTPYEVLARIIWQPLFPLDINAHHMQWEGKLLPPGVVNNGGIISVAIELANVSFVYLIILSFIYSVYISLFNVILIKFNNKILRDIRLFNIIIIFAVILFISDPGGNLLLIFLIIMLFILASKNRFFTKKNEQTYN